MKSLVGCAMVCAIASSTLAQGQAGPPDALRCVPNGSRDRFTSFFERTLGDWDVTIRDFDEQGTPTPESRQTRSFQRAIGDRYVEERAFVAREGAPSTPLGLMLHSFDDQSGQVLITSFWPRSPRRWAEVEGCLVGETSVSVVGTIRSYRPGEAVRNRRIEIAFGPAGELRWRGFAVGVNGREYLAEELVYTRPVGISAPGDMDALLGPATRVNQGVGMTDDIRAALAPGPEHAVLARLVGDWRSEPASRDPVTSPSQTMQVRRLLGGAWFEMRHLTGGEVTRIAHLGFDGYRGTYAMWEIGQGFTSPQARAGEHFTEGRELRFHRRYTIQRRGVPTPIHERLVITFLDERRLRWRSVETIGREPERVQRDVVLVRIP